MSEARRPRVNPSMNALLSTLLGHGVRWQILSYDQAPGSSIAWLRAMPAARELVSAMDRTLVIAETDVVARLRVHNPTLEPVLVPADLVVDGGKQARVFERSVVVPSHGAADVPVRCVEAGRWHGKGGASETRCSVAAPASTASREYLAHLKKEALRARSSWELEQADVWSHVASELRRAQVASRTESYAALLHVRAQRAANAQYMAHPPRDANGFALVRAGAIWVEVFPTCEHVDAIVSGVVADLLVEGTASQPTDEERRRRAEAAIRRVATSALVALDPLPDTAGDAFAFDGTDIAGSVLLHEGRLAHLAATVTR